MLHVFEFLSFLRLNSNSFVCIVNILLIHSSIDGHLDCFYFLAIVNNATDRRAQNDLILTHKEESLWEYCYHNLTFGYLHARTQVLCETLGSVSWRLWQEKGLKASRTRGVA